MSDVDVDETREPDPYDWARVWVCACGTERLNIGWIYCAVCGMRSPMGYEISERRAS